MRRIIIIALSVIILTLVIISVIFLQNLKTKTIKSTTPSPTTNQTNQLPTTTPGVRYKKGALGTLLKEMNNRPTPNIPSDTTIRQQLIDSLNGRSGTLQSTTDYTLKYIQAPNDFESEIKTIDIAKAQDGIINFLRSKGLTNDGICKLPLAFYLNFAISQKLKGTSYIFSPIPDFCK